MLILYNLTKYLQIQYIAILVKSVNIAGWAMASGTCFAMGTGHIVNPLWKLQVVYLEMN